MHLSFQDVFQDTCFVLELLLLGWITWQGELIRFYEREVFRMNNERYEERKKWRTDKQKAALKKQTEPKTSDSEKTSASPSTISIADEKSSTTNASAAVVN